MTGREKDGAASLRSGGPAEAPSDTLRALADRCEREGPSRGLDIAIACAALDVEWYDETHELMRRVGDTGWSIRAGALPRFTTSLDAAVTLVPEGWRLHSLVDWYGHSSACLHRAFGIVQDEAIWKRGHSWPPKCRSDGKAFTKPAALCAAALRARAAVLEQEGPTP